MELNKPKVISITPLSSQGSVHLVAVNKMGYSVIDYGVETEFDTIHEAMKYFLKLVEGEKNNEVS